RQPPLLETIPIAVVINETANIGRQLHSEPESSGSNTPVDAGLASHASVSQTPHRRASNSSGISVDHKVRFELAQLNSVFSSQYLGTTGKRAPSRGRGTTHLIEKADREPAEIEKADREAEVEEADRDPEAKEADDDDDDVEEADGGARELTINRRTEWQD